MQCHFRLSLKAESRPVFSLFEDLLEQWLCFEQYACHVVLKRNWCLRFMVHSSEDGYDKNWAINLWTTQKRVWYGCNQFQSTRCFYELTQISMNRSLVFLYFNWGKVKSLTVVCQGTSTLNLCRRECIWLMMTYTDIPNKGLPKERSHYLYLNITEEWLHNGELVLRVYSKKKSNLHSKNRLGSQPCV